MFTVMMYDECVMDAVELFAGSLDECRAFIDGDDDLYIVEPDGFSVVD